jgi:predicted permease
VATVLAASTAMFFGLAPALHATRGTLGESIKSATGGTRGARSWARSALLVGQVSASVVLLFGSALFLGSLSNLRAAELGFDADRLLVFRVDPRLSQYEEERVPLLYRELQRAYAEIPGVDAVSFSRHALLTGGRRTLAVAVAGQPEEAAAPALMNPVGPDFFETMRIPLLMGRSLAVRDDVRSPRVVVVNETFVQSRLAGQQPLGRVLRVGDQDWEIVGVAAEAKYYDVRADVQGTVYQPFLQTETGQGAFVLRATGDPASLLPAVRDATRNVDPTLTIFDADTQRAAAEAMFGEERVLATMTTALGALALFLTVIGIYGATSYATAQRTGEIGLRIALGASGWGILWLTLRRTLALVVVGLGLGLGASLLGSGRFTRLLYGLTAADLPSMLLVAGVIGAAALAAAYVAARRAKRISPLDALRHE